MNVGSNVQSSVNLAWGMQRKSDQCRSTYRARFASLRNIFVVSIAVLLLGRTVFFPVSSSTEDASHRARQLSEVDTQEVPCSSVRHVSSEEKCAFVTEHCQTEALVNYLQIYYCRVQPAGWWARLSMLGACVVGMLLLFRVLSTTAEDYFSPILTQMSKDFYLPPRLAGVTLMAWGNGAPDIFSSMAAVKGGEYQLALGGQLGAGMFIGTVVVGCVLRAGNGASMRGALIRDISSYMLAVVAVTSILASGKVTMGKAVSLLGGYCMFVAIVCAADIVHRLRHKPDPAPEESKDLEEGLLPPPDSPVEAAVERAAVQAPEVLLPRPPLTSSRPQSASAEQLSDRSIEMSEAKSSERARSAGGDMLGDLPPPHIGRHARHSAAGALPLSPPLSYHDIVHMPGSKYRERAWAALSDSPSFRRLRVRVPEEDETEAAAGLYHPPTRTSVDNSFLTAELCDAAIEAAGPRQSATATAAAQSPPQSEQAASGVDLHSHRPLLRTQSRWLQAAHYKSLQGLVEQLFLQRLLAFVAVLEWPLTIARRATIPLLEQECYSRPWLITSLACGPIAVALYLRCSPAGIIVAAALGAAAAAAAFYTTKDAVDQEVPPDWGCGLAVPLGAVLVALAGFAVACMWIDTIASELVGLLRFFGILAHISSVVLGLTLLAWGNSIPDLITDVAMARTGFCNMAMTACFAGPLCNMLCGLGLGFMFLLLSVTAGSAVDVQLTTPVLTDAILVAFNCGLLLVLGLLNGGHLPPRLTVLLSCLYGVYLLINLGVNYL